MGTMTPTEFVPEGGKLHLANRLHALYRFNIRCPSCPGNRGMAGFIRSQSRKPDKKNRLKRRFNCQRHEKCAHLSCREFIELARRHLSSEVFRAVVRTVCSDFPAKNLGIRQYLLDSESEPTLSQVPGDIYTENTQAVSNWTSWIGGFLTFGRFDHRSQKQRKLLYKSRSTSKSRVKSESLDLDMDWSGRNFL
jgi:hypothetical protein